MNTAMAQLNEHIGADVPSFEEVREKIEARYTKAKAPAELSETSVESRGPRGRAGDGERRGPEPAQPAALRARPRHGDEGRRASGGTARRRAAGSSTRVLTRFQPIRRSPNDRVGPSGSAGRGVLSAAVVHVGRRVGRGDLDVAADDSNLVSDAAHAAAKPSAVYSMAMTSSPNTSVYASHSSNLPHSSAIAKSKPIASRETSAPSSGVFF